jgi:protein TonB
MREPVSSNHVPAKYRIGLALSAAFLVHTLIFSGLPSPITEDTPKPQHNIHFELVFPGSRASVPSASEATREIPENRNPAFEISPAQTPEMPLPSATTPSSRNKVPEPKATPEPKTNETAARPQPSPAPANAAPPERKATSHNADNAGTRSSLTSEQAEDQPTRITQSPSHNDPYIAKLAERIGKKVQAFGVRAVDLSQGVVVPVELKLLENGTLTRARIVRSSGVEQVDVSVYEATLAASPYPRPPENNNQNRFVVEVKVYPKRL